MEKIPHDPDEIVAVVDGKDMVIGQASRNEVHEKGLLHREVCVYVVNPRKQVLLHRRADNHYWDHSCSGHFPKDQDYEEAALREFEEELGIRLKKGDFRGIGLELLKTTNHKGINNRFARIFLVKKDIPLGDFKIDKKEVEEIDYFDAQRLDIMLNNPDKILTKSAKKIIKEYILKEIQ